MAHSDMTATTSHYYTATVSQQVVVRAPSEAIARALVARHLPGRSIYGVSVDYGGFEVRGLAVGLEITSFKDVPPDEVAKHLTRSEEIERVLAERRKL